MTSAIASLPDGSVTSPAGFTAAAAHAGLKADGALDVALVVSTTSCATAGVFTRNAARAANACTGPEGLEAARAMARAAEEAAGLPPRTALVLSTGVIGVPLPVDKVAGGLRDAAAK